MGVVAVHSHQFPVSEVFGLVGTTVGEYLAGRRGVDQQVEDRRRIAQIGFQRLALLCEAGEHEAAVRADSRRLAQPHFFHVKPVAVALFAGHRNQRAGAVVGPAVVPALKELAVSRFGFAYLGPSMAAPVDQHPHRLVDAAHQQHRRATNRAHLVVTPLGHFALMSDINPHCRKYALHLEFKDRGIGVDARMHASITNQRGERGVGIRTSPLNDLLIHHEPLVQKIKLRESGGWNAVGACGSVRCRWRLRPGGRPRTPCWN